MVKFRMKTKIMAVVTFLMMSAAIILSGYDMQNAEATGGTDYVKYTYATGQTQTYNLPEIPTINYHSTMSRNLPAIIDTRPPADWNTAVVSISDVSAGTNIGTGFIIGDHEIMTVSHNVYNGTFRSYSIIIPDANPYNVNTSVVINPVAVHVPQKYIDYKSGYIGGSSQDYDYAIITVEEDLSQYGSFLLGMASSSVITNNIPVHCLGYFGRTLKTSSGTMTSINTAVHSNYTENSYSFNLFTFNQTSGGPIYVESSCGVSGTSNEDYQIKTYRTVISLASTGNMDSSNPQTNGYIIGPEVLQFAYSNSYL